MYKHSFVIQLLLVVIPIFAQECSLRLVIWFSGEGCYGVANATTNLFANGTCQVDTTREGPGVYIAQCNDEGIDFLASGCISNDCSPPASSNNASSQFSPSVCESNRSTTSYLYSGVGTTIPLNTCQNLVRNQPSNNVSFIIYGDCSQDACPRAPTVSPAPTSGAPSIFPTMTTHPSAYPTFHQSPMYSVPIETTENTTKVCRLLVNTDRCKDLMQNSTPTER
jgi:hypothetical protein